MHNIVVLVNPRSGHNLRDKLRIWKIRSLVAKGAVYATKSWDELDKVASELPQMKPDIIAIDGGDGTISTVVGAVYKHWPQDTQLPYFSFLRGGTFNALPKYVGIENGISYLKTIANTPKEQLFFQDVDFMEVEDNHKRKFLGFSFGIGLPVLLLQEFYKKKKKRWKYLRVALMMLKLLLSAAVGGEYFQRFNRHIPLKVGDKEGKWLSVICQTIPSFGLPKCGMFYRAGITHGKFHALATESPLNEVCWYATAIYGGRSVPIAQLDLQTNSLHIHSDTEFIYQVNGELDYWGERCIANEVHIRHGLTLKIVKAIPQEGS
jgi:diacylglycerol kinase family enzyme